MNIPNPPTRRAGIKAAAAASLGSTLSGINGRVDPYAFRLFGKTRCTLQLNVQNAFDRYKVIILPNIASGAPQLARYTNDPRLTVLTARFGF